MFDRKADVSFTHLFNAMFSSGEARQMGPTAFMVFCCIKSFTNLNRGNAFPGQKMIAELTGRSVDTVKRSIDELIDMGYIQVHRNGSHNEYQINERIAITNREGRVVEEAWFKYVPTAVNEVQRQVKEYIDRGSLGDRPVIHIDKIEVNIVNNNNYGTQITTNNVNMNGPDDSVELKNRMRDARDRNINAIYRVIGVEPPDHNVDK